MELKKFQRGDRLQPVLLELQTGVSVKIPYRFYSENSLRATISQLKANIGAEYEINTRSNTAAIVTRIK